MSWSVDVTIDGELVVSIGDRMVAGRDLSYADSDLIRSCANHLLAFVGQPVEPHSQQDLYEILISIVAKQATDIAQLTDQCIHARADAAAIRELMNIYNIGGWTDIIAPMKRALKAEAELAAILNNVRSGNGNHSA